jgi:hypothetical protein
MIANRPTNSGQSGRRVCHQSFNQISKTIMRILFLIAILAFGFATLSGCSKSQTTAENLPEDSSAATKDMKGKSRLPKAPPM